MTSDFETPRRTPELGNMAQPLWLALCQQPHLKCQEIRILQHLQYNEQVLRLLEYPRIL
jgi:hypothetical protein